MSKATRAGLPWAELPGQAVKALYFSVVTFTSLGCGDMQPHGSAGQVLSILEAGTGVVLIALFVGCVIRKLSR